MRLTRLVALCLGVAAMTACDSDDVTDPTLPPHGNVRLINALSDTGNVDIRMIDQVELGAFANNLQYRAGTVYIQTEAKERRIRVFPTSTNPAVTSQIILDTTIAIQANSKVTLLLTGSARARTARFITINDEVGPPPSGQISIRMVNASTGAVSGHVVATAATAIGATPTFANVAPLSASSYINRATGAVALRTTDAGGATVTASLAGPATPAGPAGAAAGTFFPAAGVSTAGTVFSVYYYPRTVAGSGAPQTAAFTSPALVWFVDRNPAD